MIENKIKIYYFNEFIHNHLFIIHFTIKNFTNYLIGKLFNYIKIINIQIYLKLQSTISKINFYYCLYLQII